MTHPLIIIGIHWHILKNVILVMEWMVHHGWIRYVKDATSQTLRKAPILTVIVDPLPLDAVPVGVAVLLLDAEDAVYAVGAGPLLCG